MKLRHRILILAILLTAVPLVTVIILSGREISTRFQAQDTVRVEARIRAVKADLETKNQNLAILLDTLAEAMKTDNRLRLSLASEDPGQRDYLVDYASRQMSLMRLDMLQIPDAGGRILSAAPLAGAQGMLEPGLPGLLANAHGNRALMMIRSPSGSFLALARTRPLDLAGRHLFLIAGTSLDQHQLETWGLRNDLATALIWPGGAIAGTPALQELCARLVDHGRIVYDLQRRNFILRSEAVPFIQGDSLQDAWLLVAADQRDLHQFIAELRRRLWLLLIVAVVLSALLAVWLTARITRPLAELARRTADVDLDRLDVDFGSDRGDEVGDLSRLLNQMTTRLRQGLTKLRAAEQRATLGEVARQVNHDIRNGLTPVRNVLRHLGEVATEEPAQLPEIFLERRDNLEEGLAYLEQLADRYARLSPVAKPEPCHLDRIIQDVINDMTPVGDESGLIIANQVPSTLPAIIADPVALRRIYTNLLRNALESLPAQGGRITFDGTIAEDPELEEPRILLSISDNGCGIPPENQDLIFQDFFTTRTAGTGLGLSNVRRLIGDLGGNIKVTSVPDRGTTFTISLPLVEPGSPQP